MKLNKNLTGAACVISAACMFFSSAVIAQRQNNETIVSYSWTDSVPVPPAGQAYLGGAINDPSLCPLGKCSGTFDETIAQMTDEFEKSSNFNRTLAVHMLYYNFNDTFATSTTWSLQQDPRLSDDFAHGRIPIISWNCSGSNGSIFTTRGVAEGRYDPMIEKAAINLGGLGRPVFLRYFWEMNLATGKNAACEEATNHNLTEIEQNYKDAFRHIVRIFRRYGAWNVSFIWSPWAGTAWSHYFDSQYPDGRKFFPGGMYVDWIGIDIYDPTVSRSNDFATVMTSQFIGTGYYDNTPTRGSPVYSTYTNPAIYGSAWGTTLPIMISETGALYDTAGQAKYLSTMQTDISAEFRAIRAVSYFNKNDVKNWLLGNGQVYVGPGMAAFTKMGHAAGFKCWYNNAEQQTNCYQ